MRNANEKTRRWLTGGDVARMLGLSRMTVGRLAEEGILPFIRPNPLGERRFPAEEIERIAKGEKPTAVFPSAKTRRPAHAA